MFPRSVVLYFMFYFMRKNSLCLLFIDSLKVKSVCDQELPLEVVLPQEILHGLDSSRAVSFARLNLSKESALVL